MSYYCGVCGHLCDRGREHTPSQKIKDESVTTFNLLHHLWTKAVGTSGYEKKEWQLLEARLLELEKKLRVVADLVTEKKEGT